MASDAVGKDRRDLPAATFGRQFAGGENSGLRHERHPFLEATLTASETRLTPRLCMRSARAAARYCPTSDPLDLFSSEKTSISQVLHGLWHCYTSCGAPLPPEDNPGGRAIATVW